MGEVVTTVLEVFGFALIVATAVLIFWPAAFAVAGVALILISRGIAK